MMHSVPQPGLTVPAVAGKLSEGLGSTQGLPVKLWVKVKALPLADTQCCFPLHAEEGGVSGLQAAAPVASERSPQRLVCGGPTN